jgi:hypothetical protein
MHLQDQWLCTSLTLPAAALPPDVSQGYALPSEQIFAASNTGLKDARRIDS